MSHISNRPGTTLTLEEELVLSELAALGSPFDILRVNSTGSGIEYVELHWYEEVPTSGTVDGVNKIFSFQHKVQLLFLEEAHQSISNGNYSIDSTGKIVTFSIAPGLGGNLPVNKYQE